MDGTLRDVRERISRTPVQEWGKQLFHQVKEDELTTRAAAFAYHTMFAIPPLLILAVLVGSLLDRVTAIPVVERLHELVRERAPADTQELLTRLIDNAVADVGGGLASFGVVLTVLLALWGGAGAVGSLIDGFNRAYGVEDDRPFVRKKLVTIGLTLLLIVVVNLAFVLPVFGQRLGDRVADWVGIGGAFDIVWGILRWLIAIAAIVLLLALLYSLGPNVQRPLRWFSPGAVVATVGWLVAILGFGLYLRFSNPGSAYGALGGMIVLLFFLYLTGVVFLLGAEIDALLGRRSAPTTTQDRVTAETKPQATIAT
jgi:membrane protein